MDEFLKPFYFIINLAIGGTLTDAYNLGDRGSGENVSMPMPVHKNRYHHLRYQEL